MTESTTPPHADDSLWDDEAIKLIGWMVVAFARLESRTAHCLGCLAGTHAANAPSATARSTRLKYKLDLMRCMVAGRFAGQPKCKREFRLWYRKVNKLRARRNAIIHNCWEDEAVLSEPSIQALYPTMLATDGTFPIDELREDIAFANELCEALAHWRRRWSV
jgi:hypothetical protein